MAIGIPLQLILNPLYVAVIFQGCGIGYTIVTYNSDILIDYWGLKSLGPSLCIQRVGGNIRKKWQHQIFFQCKIYESFNFKMHLKSQISRGLERNHTRNKLALRLIWNSAALCAEARQVDKFVMNFSKTTKINTFRSKCKVFQVEGFFKSHLLHY